MIPTRTGRKVIALTSCFVLAVLSACSNHQLSDAEFFKQLEESKASAISENQPTQFDQARAAYQEGIETNLALYAPLAWERFDGMVRSAVSADKEDRIETSNRLAESALKAYKLARNNEEQVKSLMPEPTRLLAELDRIKANRVHKSDYEDITDDYRDLAEQIEEEGDELDHDNLEDDMADLVEDINQLQVKTLLTLHWKPSQNTIDKIEDRDLEDLAPRSYTEAVQLTNNARKRIEENFASPEACEVIGLEALRSAQHALYVGQEVQKILNLNKKSAEETILRFEDYMARIGDALDAGDQRNMALIDQSMSLAQKAQEMRSRIEAPLKAQIESLQLELDTLKAQMEVEENQQESSPAPQQP